MSFKDYDKKTFIVDSGQGFRHTAASRSAQFLQKMGMAGVGFSAFNVGLLGNVRRDRGFYLGD